MCGLGCLASNCKRYINEQAGKQIISRDMLLSNGEKRNIAGIFKYFKGFHIKLDLFFICLVTIGKGHLVEMG